MHSVCTSRAGTHPGCQVHEMHHLASHAHLAALMAKAHLSFRVQPCCVQDPLPCTLHPFQHTVTPTMERFQHLVQKKKKKSRPRPPEFWGSSQLTPGSYISSCYNIVTRLQRTLYPVDVSLSLWPMTSLVHLTLEITPSFWKLPRLGFCDLVSFLCYKRGRGNSRTFYKSKVFRGMINGRGREEEEGLCLACMLS